MWSKVKVNINNFETNGLVFTGTKYAVEIYNAVHYFLDVSEDC
jgi:hypothetical protein